MIDGMDGHARSYTVAAQTVVTGDAVHSPGWLSVSAGRITAVGHGRLPGPPDEDFGAAVVVPGFVDMHVHGGAGRTFAEATPEAVEAAVQLHRRHGTTTTVASLVAAEIDALVAGFAVFRQLTEARVIAGVHLEGPWLAPARAGVHDRTLLKPPTPADVRTIVQQGRGVVRMVTLAPELPGGLATVQALTRAGIVVAVGHTDAGYEQAKAAIDAGATVATHLFNAMPPIHHRSPGPVLALLDDDRVTLELIADGVHLAPATVRHVTRAAGANRVALVTDAMAAAGQPDGVAPSGLLAGGVATMDQLFRNAFEGARNGGASREEALLTAVAGTSVVPARALGLPEVGLLAAGRLAHAVVLTPELQVARVLR